ncbi:hypothetical protein FHE72_01305 [Rossellomorea vietnamensis]|uniref:Uncharacterized protein n=1 Tax=Rossellomorea vietnamensis TaxID=218284 RepID=A0A6I6UMP8_9BACI|nr:hypothetical protein [Rossellomorea vietnamensis]QHE59830.1 hypothetical protein FHE72_01305 [Rossellomorea vietnamensis]
MNLTENLTVEDLQVLLRTMYQKGIQEEVNTREFLNEIKENIIALCTTNEIDN